LDEAIRREMGERGRANGVRWGPSVWSTSIGRGIWAGIRSRCAQRGRNRVVLGL